MCWSSTGCPSTDLAERFGTPLVVYSEDALRERARMFQRAVPDALVVYGTKAFPNVAADATARGGGTRRGRLDARRARVRAAGGDRRASGCSCTATTSRTRSCVPPPRRARWSSSTRSTSRRGPPRPACGACSSASRRASRRRRTRRSAPATAAPSSVSTRATPLEAVRAALGAGARGRRAARPRRLAARGRAGSPGGRRAARRVRGPLPRRSSTGCPRTIDIGGGFGIRHVQAELEPPVEELVRAVADAVDREWLMRGLARLRG